MNAATKYTLGVRTLLAAVILVALAISLTSCADKYKEPFKDAPRGATNDGPADTITMPDGFSNAATKCDHGNRLYVAYHGDSAYASLTVVPNAPDCQ